MEFQKFFCENDCNEVFQNLSNNSEKYKENSVVLNNKTDSLNNPENNPISPALSIDDFRIILFSYLGSHDCSLNEFCLIPLEERTGSLGDYFKLQIKVTHKNIKKQLNLFAKFLPSKNESTNALVRSGPSKKEDFFYNYFIKEFKKCGLQPYTDFSPRCYLSKIDHVLVLEDLALEGYHVTKPMTFYTFDMLKLTIRQLAKLHACSLILEEIKSMELGASYRLGDFYAEYLREVLFQTEVENEIKLLSDVAIQAVTDYIIYLYPEVVKNMKMEAFRQKSLLAFKSFYKKTMKSETYRNTLCHGDVWATNILFKFNNTGQPIDCKLIDYQLTRYCPPTQDLLSHLYLTTTKETRTKYMPVLLKHYYTELSKIVRNFGFDENAVFPYDQFKQCCDYMKSQGICQALLYAPINLSMVEDREMIFTDQEKFERVMKKDRTGFVEEMMKKHETYRMVIGELVEDLYEICESNQF